MTEFDPNVTQKIALPEQPHVTVDFVTMTRWQLFKLVLEEMHKHVVTWYSYLVGLSIILQEYWKNFESWLPVRWRHIILIGVTVMVVVDKIVVAGRGIKTRLLNPDGV